MNADLKLFDAEYRLALIVWENEPVISGELARLCEEKFGWKRTTTYTVLKKLCNRGIMRNENATVTALIKKEQVQRYESRELLDKRFDSSLPGFIASFMGSKKISKQEADQLKKLIDSYREE